MNDRTIGTRRWWMLVALALAQACGAGSEDGVGAPGDVAASGAGTGSTPTGGSGGTSSDPEAGSGGAGGGIPVGGSGGSGGETMAGAGGTTAGAGAGGDTMVEPPVGDGPVPVLPNPSDACPTLATGIVQVKGQDVQLWVGTPGAGKSGPMMFYWHGTGGMSDNAMWDLGPGVINEITAEGGMVASFSTTTGTGANTGNGVWYTGDFEMVDVLVKCAIEQLDADPRRIYSAGCSAGGLQTGAMVYGRSSYLAAAMPNSGGVIFPGMLEDPAHVPSVITAHGGDSDMVFIYFRDTSKTLYDDVAAKGGYVVNCDHGGGHCLSPPEVKAAQWEFLKAHPFGVSPDPYAAGLPGTFPAACTIIE